MSKRMKAEERREQLQALMTDMHRQAETQGDFTAEAVARAAGISTVLLYRYAGAEFQALRVQLPGTRRVRDEVMSELRQENVLLQQQLQEAQEKLRATALSELDEAIRMIELLEERTRVVVHVPASRSPAPILTVVGGEKENEEVRKDEKNLP